MSITERERRDLYEGLESALGPERADTLMTMLPDQPADQLVTIPFFQTEMAAHRSELRAEMAELRTELKGDVLRVENSLSLRMADMQTSMNRWALGLTAANVLGMVTALAT